MPTSHMAYMSDIMYYVDAIRPRRTLDIGIGCGKYGFLTREIVEIHGLARAVFSTAGPVPTADETSAVIDGVEVFEQYVTPLHRLVYNKIMIGNALDILPKIDAHSYDMAIAIDVLEHFTEPDGRLFLERCHRVADAVLIATPNGVYEQGTACGNEHEVHRSTWTRRKLTKCGYTVVMVTRDTLLAMAGSSPEVAALCRRSKWRMLYRKLCPEIIRESGFREFVRAFWPRG